MHKMSKLQKMTIQGIRSFSPNDKNVVEFYSPLTLIVGANGTGKTTIIECLKYMTTGDMPPNSKNGAFIYDPKIAKEIDVKAEIKLEFSNNKNETLVCTRSIQSTVKKTKIEQKTLETTLSKMNGNNLTLISSKIADIDREIPVHMGVSQSILEDVIFCHQDESTWPLSDPGSVKKKLDDIFSSTKYNKALLGLKGTKKEILSELKLKTNQLSFFLKDKIKRDDLIKNKSNLEADLEKKSNKLVIFTEEIVKIEKHINVFKEELDVLTKLEEKYSKLSNEYEERKKFILNFGEERMIHGVDDLEAYQTSLENKIREIEENSKNIDSIRIEEEFLKVEGKRKSILDINSRNGKVQNAIENVDRQIEQIISEQKGIINSLKEKLKLKVLPDNRSANNILNRSNDFNNISDNNYSNNRSDNIFNNGSDNILNRSNDSNNRSNNNILNRSNDSNNIFDNNILNNISDNRSNLININDIIKVLEKLYNEEFKLVEADVNLKSSNVERLKLECFENQSKTKEILKEITENKQRLGNLEIDYKFLNDNKNELSFYNIVDENNLNSKALKPNTKEMMWGPETNLDLFDLNIFEINLTELNNKKILLEQEIESLNLLTNVKQNELNDEYSEGSYKRIYLSKQMAELKNIVEGFDFASLKQENKIKAKNLIQEKDNLKNYEVEKVLQVQRMENIYKKFLEIKKFINQILLDGKSLVEMKDVLSYFNNVNDVDRTSDTMPFDDIKYYNNCWSNIKDVIKNRNKICNILNAILEDQTIINIQAMEKDLQECKNIVSVSNHASSVYLNFCNLGEKKNECPLCKKGFKNSDKLKFLERLRKVISKIPESIKNAESRISVLETTILDSKRVNEDVEIRNNNIRNILKGLSDIEPDINVLKHNSDIDVLKNDKYNDLITNIKRLETETVEINKKIDDYTNSNILMEKISLELKRLPVNADFEAIKAEVENNNKLIFNKKSSLKDLDIKIKLFERIKINIYNIKLKSELSEKNKILIKNLKSLNTGSINIDELVKEVEVLRTNHIKSKLDFESKIKRVRALELDLADKKLIIANLQAKIVDKIESFVKFNNQLFDLKEDQNFEKIRNIVLNMKDEIIRNGKELQTNKNLLKLVGDNIELKYSKEQVLALADQIGGYDFTKTNSLKSKIESYTERKIKTSNNEAAIKGELKQMIGNLRAISNDLDNNYKDSNKNYLKCNIEIKALEMGLEDLDKCINALDKAIVDFHSSKIEDVNRILKELWSETYKGNDIEYIELKSESSDTRAYNYRIVMVKNGAEVDMRGRSSAGQKMIASILFRIALADSFSLGCNVFALDEPTTNLDKENVESLSYSLSQIIKERTNVQLIVITHDEDFVQMLNREGVEYYYRLKRDSRGNGRITKQSIYG